MKVAFIRAMYLLYVYLMCQDNDEYDHYSPLFFDVIDFQLSRLLRERSACLQDRGVYVKSLLYMLVVLVM